MITALTLSLIAIAPQDPPEIDARLREMVEAIDPGQLEITVRDLVSFGTRHVQSSTDDPERGTGAARSYLEEKLRSYIPRSGGRLTVEREAYTVVARRLGGEVEVVNIVATLRGTTDPDRVYVIGGHYDSINGKRDSVNDAPGANDDGSGTAAAVEACRVMCAYEFPATIKFVCYDGEEQGLLGSNAHARALGEAEVRVDGMITNDIVGNSMGMDGVVRDHYIRAFSYSRTGNDSTGRNLARAAAWAARVVPDFEVKLMYRGDRYGRGGDHRPFFEQGFPSIRMTEPREDFSRQHQDVTQRDGAPYGDLPEFMDFNYLSRVVGVDVALLGELASAPPAPAAVNIRGARRSYDTQVTWAPVEGVEDYEVLWRETTEPHWSEQLVVGPEDYTQAQGRRRGLTFSLEGVCVDDVVVAVRSIGVDGARSRALSAPDGDRLGGSTRRGR